MDAATPNMDAPNPDGVDVDEEMQTAPSSADAEAAPQPLVLFFHKHDATLWGSITEALRSFAERCEAGEAAGAEELQQGLREVRGLTGGRATSSTLGAFLKAAHAAPDKGLCDAKALSQRVLPFVARLAMDLPVLFPEGLPYLTQKRSGQVFLTRRQCGALLAGALFGAIPNPERQAKEQGMRLHMPGFDLGFVLDVEVTKCLCLICYFAQLAEASEAFLQEVVSFSRRVVNPSPADFWRKCDKPLSKVEVQFGAIEDSHGNLQADFANEFLGGGVLQGGNVQEEIRFSVCPECLVGMLFCEQMLWYEAIFIVGSQQYSKYSGYGRSFRFDGPHLEVHRPPADGRNRVGPHIAALDALVFPGAAQYEEGYILRELTKAHAACLGDLTEDAGERCRAFATGNWGCGVFGGDPQLKSLIQWLAASVADRDLVYFPFGDDRVKLLPEVVDAVQASGARCSNLFELLTMGHQPHCAAPSPSTSPRPGPSRAMAGVDQKKAQLKQKFRSMDKNGDGMLDFNEFLGLMSGMDTRTAHKLFEKCDTSGDGTIQFDEFVDYIYSTSQRGKARTTEGRHQRLAAMSAVSADSEDAALWDSCQAVYQSYAGLDEKFEGKDFKKLCVDCKLFDRKFTKNDVDIVFAKHKTRGKNTVNFSEFQNCVRGIAQKKGVPTRAVQAAVAEREELGVQQNATQADFVRFHDDKSTYTGQHVFNENHEGAGHSEQAPGARSERIRTAEQLSHEGQDELPWHDVEKAFYAFCKGDSYLDGREFSQLCQDCKLFSRSFSTADADIIFNKVKNRGERKIDYEQFKDACIGVAQKRGSSVKEVQRAVVSNDGPAMHGTTQADNVRFHDDKSLYTGMHANNDFHSM